MSSLAAIATQPAAGEPGFVSRIRLRARRRILWMRRLWTNEPGDSTQGLAISHAEVDRILADRAELLRAEESFYRTDKTASEITDQIDHVDLYFNRDESWNRLRAEFALAKPEIDLLSLAIAREFDPALGRAYGYLHDDAGATIPTPWLAATLFQWNDGNAIGAASALMRWHLARPVDPASIPNSATTPWISDAASAGWILRQDYRDPVVMNGVATPKLASFSSIPCLYPAQL